MGSLGIVRLTLWPSGTPARGRLVDLTPRSVDLALYAGDGAAVRIVATQPPPSEAPVNLSGQIAAHIRTGRRDPTPIAEFIVDSYRYEPELMKVIVVEVTRAANTFGRTHLAKIREAYEQTAVRFRWQEDDVLLIDNMLTSHARDPFSGPRKIVVAMSELYPS